MVNERIDTIRVAGSDAVQVRLDLADAELLAVARSVETVDLSLVEGLIPDLQTLESLAGGACAVTVP